jgi:hypothetical protein
MKNHFSWIRHATSGDSSRSQRLGPLGGSGLWLQSAPSYYIWSCHRNSPDCHCTVLAVLHMDTPETRLGNFSLTGAPLSPTLTDYVIRSQGGTTTAFDTRPEEVQKKKDPISAQDRLVELRRENGRLRWELACYRPLEKEVLKPLLALVEFHEHGLDSTVQRFNAKIERFNIHWQSGPRV